MRGRTLRRVLGASQVHLADPARFLRLPVSGSTAQRTVRTTFHPTLGVAEPLGEGVLIRGFPIRIEAFHNGRTGVSALL
jgi:hypothetical protein